MIDIFKFILFLIYTISVFFIGSYYGLFLIAIFNLSLMIILKIGIKKSVKNILQIMPYVILSAIINLIFQDIKGAVLVFIRLILVCNMTYIFSKVITTTRVSNSYRKTFLSTKTV